MTIVSTVITDIRDEVNDPDSLRWSDAAILRVLRQAIRRANRIVQRNGISFGRKKGALTTVASTAYVSLPADFDIPIGLYRDDTHEKLIQRTEDEFERINSAAVLENWMLDMENSYIRFNGTPTSAVSLSFYYYPTVDPSAYTTASTMPWGGRLDDIIGRYTALRLQNIDEMNVAVDLQLLQDFENQIVLAYQPQNPTAVAGDGWMDID